MRRRRPRLLWYALDVIQFVKAKPVYKRTWRVVHDWGTEYL